MTVETFDHTFNQQGPGEYNDEVYGSKVFDLKDSEYSIQLTPGQATLYWRFGMALSTTEDFEFEPQFGRYNNQDLRFIEINVGIRNNGKWENHNYIQLSSYYINDGKPPYDPTGTYEPGTMVEFNVRHRQGDSGAPDEILFSYITSTHPGESVSLPVGGYRYFKLFAWADSSPFQLHAHIIQFRRDTPVQYWLLRLMSQTWDITAFYVGRTVWHGSHTSAGKRRVEYALYRQIRKGDMILGIYVGDYQAISCEFVVTEALHSDPTEGDIVSLMVTRLFSPYIPIDPYSIFRYVPQDPPEERDARLLLSGESTFKQMTAADLDFPKLALTEPEKKYLEILYKNLLEGKEINSSYSLSEIWNDDLPKSFRPEQMDPQLVGSGRDITLLAVCQIHPESSIFFQFEKVLYTIQKIVGDGKEHSQVGSAEIGQQLPDISLDEVFQIFKLMQPFHRLMTGLVRKSGTELAILIGDNSIYEEYRQFAGLASFMAEYLRKNPPKNEPVAKRMPGPGDQPAQTADFFRTNGIRRSRSDFSPVLGVQFLAEQLANMIYSLPPDSQMVGIFGKWGRGKTFLLDEMWTYIDKTWNKHFIKIVYHAWKYQETPASWAYLYEQFADTYLGKRTWLNFPCYYLRLFRLNFKRLGLQPLIFLGFSFAALVLWVIYSPQILNSEWYIWLGSDLLAVVSVSAVFRVFKKDISPKAAELIKKYSGKHSYKAALGLQADIQEELIKLLKLWLPNRKGKDHSTSKPEPKNKLSILFKKWIGWLRPTIAERKPKPRKRIFLLVEDMDRCKEERIIESIDALRVLLEDLEISTRLVIVTAIDERILKNAIRRKYFSLIGETDDPKAHHLSEYDKIDPHELVSEYIDKLFVAAAKLGELNQDQRSEFLKELIKKDIATSDRLTNESNSGPAVSDPVAANTAAADPAVTLRGQPGETRNSMDTTPQRLEPGVGSTATTSNVLGILTVQAAKSEWQGLNATEVDLLDKTVRSWVNVTPRRINIFYHRYLLCKNTLVGKYLQMAQPNPWRDLEGIQAILSLLRYYSDSGLPEAIDAEKRRVLKETAEPVQVHHADPPLKKSKTDYLYLLEILEMVVAY